MMWDRDNISFLIVAIIFLSIGLSLGINLGYIPIKNIGILLKTVAMGVAFIVAVIFGYLGISGIFLK